MDRLVIRLVIRYIAVVYRLPTASEHHVPMMTLIGAVVVYVFHKLYPRSWVPNNLISRSSTALDLRSPVGIVATGLIDASRAHIISISISTGYAHLVLKNQLELNGINLFKLE